MRANNKVVERVQRRLVVPEIAVGKLPAQDLKGRSEMIIFIGPKQMKVCEAEAA